MDKTEDFEDGELSPAERQRLRRLLTMVKFADDGDGPAVSRDGGDVTLEPGRPGEQEGSVAGRIVMENPGGTSRPFLTLRNVRDGGDLDVFIGEEAPRQDTGDAKVGSVYLEVGGGPSGGRPLKVHRRTADGWVWARWT